MVSLLVKFELTVVSNEQERRKFARHSANRLVRLGTSRLTKQFRSLAESLSQAARESAATVYETLLENPLIAGR